MVDNIEPYNHNLAPVVLFVYDRLEHTKKTIEALKLNDLACLSELFIYSDNFKLSKPHKKVNEVRKYLQTVTGFKNVTIVERDKNWGLADSIVDGVSSIIGKYGKVIVLEDDLVTSKYFLQFMNDALKAYENERKVWQVGGYMPNLELNTNQQILFLPYTTSWGWATWADRWSEFDRNPNKLLEDMSEHDIYKFNMDGASDIWSQVLKNINGEIYTWAVFWYATVFKKKGLCVYPFKSLVSNEGFDNSGEHCSITKIYDTKLLNERIGEIFFIKNISVNDTVLSEFLSFHKNSKMSIIHRIIGRLIRTYKEWVN